MIVFFCLMIADSEGRTPLHWAVDRGHLDIAEALVSKNADINAKVIHVFGSLWVLFVVFYTISNWKQMITCIS